MHRGTLREYVGVLGGTLERWLTIPTVSQHRSFTTHCDRGPQGWILTPRRPFMACFLQAFRSEVSSSGVRSGQTAFNLSKLATCYIFNA